MSYVRANTILWSLKLLNLRAFFEKKNTKLHPGWCGSVDRVPACRLKGHLFDSQAGHVPGMQARSPVGGVQEATNRCFSPSLSPSFPLSLEINK